MRELPMEEIADALAIQSETVPLLDDLGWDHRKSFNGLLSVTADASSIIGEAPEVRGFWLCEAVWVKDGPGAAHLCAEWITRGMPHMDPHAYDIARFYPAQKEREYVRGRCYENAEKIYHPPVHPREPYVSGRNLFKSPFHEREKELGGIFDNEVGGWERAYAYKANESRLGEYLQQVPVRENEWDRRHVPYEIANAEHLAMSDHVGMINLSHFAIFDIEGPDAEKMLETLSVAKVGGNKPVGKAVYTNFLDPFGGVRSDLTIARMGPQSYRIVTGGADGNRDWVYIRNYRDDHSLDANIEIKTHDIATIGLWGPKARDVLGKFVDPAELTNEAFSFASARPLELNVGNQKVPVWALRISYVGELGWEIYFDNETTQGLALYDAFLDSGVVPVGIETYASSRRLEKCFRLQGADLETEYNAYEAGVDRSKVKDADFIGKEAYLEQRNKQPAAILCTMTIDDLKVSGTARYPVGHGPLLDPKTKEVLIDSEGRRSYSNSTSYCPSIGKHAVMGYLPYDRAKVGEKVVLEYFNENGDGHYPMTVEVVGRGALYDPEFKRLQG
jgi:glycine cleavage system aminomethyltransferase T